jgi:hypothetical protein
MPMTVKFEAANDPNNTVIGAASAACGTLVDGQEYYLVATVACWVKLGAATPTAVAGTDGNMYIPPNVYVPIAKQGTADTLAVIQHPGTPATANDYISLLRVGGAP